MTTEQSKEHDESECIMINFNDYIKAKQYKEAEERFYHLSDHLFIDNVIKNVKSF
jgi:hypothetical protein